MKPLTVRPACPPLESSHATPPSGLWLAGVRGHTPPPESLQTVRAPEETPTVRAPWASTHAPAANTASAHAADAVRIPPLLPFVLRPRGARAGVWRAEVLAESVKLSANDRRRE